MCAKYAKTDQYGNNTDFPDKVMSDMIPKGLLSKWVERIYWEAKFCLKKYYMKHHNIDCGHKEFVISLFEETHYKIFYITPVLEDLVNINLYGMEDIMIAIYGVDSDEVYAYRRFLTLYEKIGNWDTDFMWNDCSSDKRLFNIINH